MPLSVTLGDALEVLIDHRGKTPKKLGGDWSAGGHRVVSAINIKDNQVDDNDHHYVNDDLYSRWMRVPLKAGDVLLTSEAPTGEVAFLDTDTDWCLGQRVFGLRGKPGVLDGRYLYYLLRGGDVRNQLLARGTGTTVSGIRQSELVKVALSLPPVQEQARVAATLGALDGKLKSNQRQRELLRRLGKAKLQAAVEATGTAVRLGDVTASIARGVAPKYDDEDRTAPIVVNQKCIRDGWVNTALARRMVSRPVASEKKGTSGDIFVNSTGTGTLGRVGRWHEGDVFVDGHVTVVRPDGGSVRPTVLAYALFGCEAEIEAMATGSTGQTELSATRLGDLVVDIPDPDAADELEAELLSFERRIAALAAEETALTQLRDVLLPELLFGRVRVPEGGPMETAR